MQKNSAAKVFRLNIEHAGAPVLAAAPEAACSTQRLLVLETSYTLEEVRQRRLEQSITCRDLDGFFEHVWSVHPFATMLTSNGWGPRYGRPEVHELAPRHTVIQGKIGRFAGLRQIFLVNFMLSQISLFRFLLKLIRCNGIDVIRTSSPLYLGLFGLGLARIARIPLVIRVGSNNDKLFETTAQPIEPRLMRSRWVEKIVERFVFPRADLVAGANQNNLDFALANGALEERSTLFRYGNLIDSRHFVEPSKRSVDVKALHALGIEPHQFLLYVGRLEPMKQPDHVVEILADVRRRGFQVKAVLAGDGRMRESLAARAAELGVADAVVLPGNLDQKRLAMLFPLAAVVLSPHTGRALTEAALGGAPVVAYDVDWQSEMIETGLTGLLVAHGDVRAMADGAARLLANSSYAAALGRALRERAQQMLDPHALDEHERDEYRKLIARRPRPRRYARRSKPVTFFEPEVQSGVRRGPAPPQSVVKRSNQIEIGQTEIVHLDWFGAKRRVARLLALPLINTVVRFAARHVLPARIGHRMPLGLRRVVYRLAGGETVLLLDPTKDLVARDLYWQASRPQPTAEKNKMRCIELLSKRAATFVDIGAYAGVCALVAARSNPKLRAVAFEIVPENYLLMIRNILENDLADRVEARLCGIGGEAGTLRIPTSIGLASHPESISLGSTFDEGVTINVRPLGPQLARFAAPFFVKIDVEGYEQQVFEGAKEFFVAERPDIICEVLPHSQQACLVITKFLEPLGYRWFVLTEAGLLPRDHLAIDSVQRDWLLTTRPGTLPVEGF